MENFAPFSAFAGGLMIGLAAVLLLLYDGRIAGVSGIMNGLLSGTGENRGWRVAFLAGIVIGAFLVDRINPALFQPRLNYPLRLLVAGGVLVGFGTRLGGGCTSGHAVCGLARLSARSLAATLTFMGAGLLTVYVLRHMTGAAP